MTITPDATPIDITRGLTNAQVAERVRSGLDNRAPGRTSRTYTGIIRSNILTRFNLIISTLAVVVLALGQPGDALFAGVMIVNAAVGIVQEVRAKRTLDRVRVLVVPMVTVRRDGRRVGVPPEGVVVDDVVELGPGDQVAVDGHVRSATHLEVDESALTGESDPVTKLPGDEVLSGSVVLAGSAVVIAERVGERAWVHQLVAQARDYLPATSELRTGVDQILGIVGWIIVPLAGLLLWSQLRADQSTDDALISSVAGVVGLVPQGLVLLVSMALAVAVIRLARDHVVVQELHAVEGLARVDVFCVDKTGTLTTGAMEVRSIDLVETDPGVVRDAIVTLAHHDQHPTTTLRVIAEHLAATGDSTTWDVSRQVAFSSSRKWSGMTVAEQQPLPVVEPTWVLGAPELLLDRIDPTRRASITASIAASTSHAGRVVLLASSGHELVDDALPDQLAPRAVIVLSEQLRPDAAATMDYFGRQGVAVKVISGDHPATVSAVATSIGLRNADRCVDMRAVDADDVTTLTDLVDSNTVFGRVMPEQKRQIVGVLQATGHTVAMTGDGVNDIPALKRADIGIAIDTATPATKAISQLVLLDGRFDRMPHVVAEGRRVIANMERVSALFVTKTVYAALFALAVGVSGSIFPFLPRQMSLVSELTIGLPAFVLSFRAADAACTPGYLRRVARFAVPAGLVAGAVTLASYWVANSPLGSATLDQARSASTLALVAFGLWVLFVLMQPADRKDLWLMGGLVALFVVTLAIEPIRDFYRLDWPPAVVLLVVALVVIAGGLVSRPLLGPTPSARVGRPFRSSSSAAMIGAWSQDEEPVNTMSTATPNEMSDEMSTGTSTSTTTPNDRSTTSKATRRSPAPSTHRSRRR